MSVDYLQVIYLCPECAIGGLQYKADFHAGIVHQWRECDHCGYRCDESAAVTTVSVMGDSSSNMVYYEVRP